MSYYMFLVETKTEYTTQLVNILYSYIYEGIYSIYQDALEVCNSNNEELKIFQQLLRKIPKWSQYVINNETIRIKKMSNQGELIEDLIKAVIKANIMILTNTDPSKKDKLKINHTITTEYFIHNCYIEVARNIFNNPFLLYQKYSNYELKRNQCKCNELIKDSIKDAIRKMLPLNLILKEYLGNSFNLDNNDDDYENVITESNKKNVQDMLGVSSKVLGSNMNFELVKNNSDKQIAVGTFGDNINDKSNPINIELKSNSIKTESKSNIKISKPDLTESEYYSKVAQNNIGEVYGNNNLNIKKTNNYYSTTNNKFSDSDTEEDKNKQSILLTSVSNDKKSQNIIGGNKMIIKTNKKIPLV